MLMVEFHRPSHISANSSTSVLHVGRLQPSNMSPEFIQLQFIVQSIRTLHAQVKHMSKRDKTYVTTYVRT